MLNRLLLLLLYFVILLVVARFFELIASNGWFEIGFVASQLVDPLSLSVKRLKSLLDGRGVSYNGALEKNELAELVNTSGDLTEGEVMAVGDTSDEEVSEAETTRFTCKAHFNEEVEDKKDSVWLIQIISWKNYHPIVPPDSWNKVVGKLSKFKIRTGIFDCSLDKSFCMEKNSIRPGLILALPEGQQPKDKVKFSTYPGQYKTQPILKWVNRILAQQVNYLHAPPDLQKQLDHRSEEVDGSRVQAVLLSKSPEIPLYYSSLSVKFTGTVEFSQMHLNITSGDDFLLDWPLAGNPGRLPVLLVVAGKHRFVYGAGDGEFVSYGTLRNLLRAFCPETNDVFLQGLILVNLSTLLELALAQGGPLRRFFRFLCAVVKLNCWYMLVFAIWANSSWLFSLTWARHLQGGCLALLRHLVRTPPLVTLQRDWNLYWHRGGAAAGLYLTFALLLGLVQWLRKGAGEPSGASDDLASFLQWWRGMTTYNSSFFQRSGYGLRGARDHPLLPIDEELNFLLQRLAVPDLWLHPAVQIDYVRDLPTWRYRSPDSSPPEEDSPPPVQPECTCGTGVGGQEERSRCRYRPSSPLTHPESANECSDCGGAPPAPVRPPAATLLPSATAPLPPDPPNSSQQPQVGDEPPGHVLECAQCAICLEPYRQGVVLCGLPCGHCYHQQCIYQWLHNGTQQWCPFCRWPAYRPKEGGAPAPSIGM